MLGVKWVPLGQIADLMNSLLVDSFFRVGKVLLNEWLPVFLRNRAERIVATGPVKRAALIQDHFLDQMFPAAEKDVTHLAVILNNASKFPLHAIAAVFENLLDPSMPGQTKGQAGFSVFVSRYARRQVAEKFLCCLERFFH